MSRILPAAVRPIVDIGQYLRERWLHILAHIGFWTLMGVLSTLQVAFFFRGYDTGISISEILFWQMVDWYFWLPMSPIILWLGRRFPLDRAPGSPATGVSGRVWPARRARQLVHGLLHLAVSMGMSVVHLANSTVVGRMVDAPKYDIWTFHELLTRLLGRYLHLDILTYWAILVAAIAYRYYNQWNQAQLSQARLQAQLSQAQLQALQSQLQPHFLFNTLHSIGVLIRKRDNQTALAMLNGLSDLLRASLARRGKPLQPVTDEVTFAQAYLKIEEIRFQDRLVVHIDIDPDAGTALVPALVLQPLAENAIRHGIAKQAAGGSVELSISVHNERLHLEVRDDGAGLPEAGVTLGVGLTNVQTRLAQLYPNDHLFALYPREPSGVIAHLDIPLRRSE